MGQMNWFWAFVLSLCCWAMPAVGAPSALAQRHAEVLREAYAQGNRWEAVSETHLHHYVLPLTSLGEDEADWLPVLRPLATELTASAKTPLEAAMALNRDLWKRIGVIYSTQREKANQDPLHSMRLGLASCSGLSILLVDACRSLGIPARVVGCVWRLKPGNHSWVEIWSEGQWYPLGAFEDCPPDKLWFLDDAAAADARHPAYAIYAACAAPGETRFFGWNVPAVNVTQRYLKATQEPEAKVFVAVERGGQRVAVPLLINGKSYQSPGPLQDMNDYTVVPLPKDGVLNVQVEGQTRRYTCKPNQILVEQLP